MALAIDDLYRKHGAVVYRRARALLGDSQAAKDALQEVFMSAIRAGEGFRGESSPVTWLYRVTTNHCLNVLRDEGRRVRLAAAQAPAEHSPGASAENRAVLRSVLARVPEELAQVAIYYYVDELNQDEIAELLGTSRRTVGNRLEAFRAAASEAVA